MKKRIIFQRPVIAVLLTVLAAFTVMMYFVNNTLFWVQLSIFLIMFTAVLFEKFISQKDVHKFYDHMADMLSSSKQESLSRFPFPVVVANDQHEIIWYNDKFRNDVIGGEDIYCENAESIFGEIKFEGDSFLSTINDIEYNNKKYTVYSLCSTVDKKKLSIFYLIDNTEIKKYYNEYFLSRPNIAIFMIDNYEEISQGASESEKTQIIGEIEYQIERYINQANGLIVKTERNKYITVLEDRYMRKIITDKFEILDRVRSISPEGKMQATLSIGIGRGGTGLDDSYNMAKQALDMCLGRGGDQAAVKTANGFDFYGGVSKGVEKRTKVKARIVASALSELIDGCDNVVLMGHRFADLDAIGSCVALATTVRKMGKMSYIAVDEKMNLSKPLIEVLKQRGYDDYFYNPSEVLSVLTKKTLLIITDTHIKTMLESPEIYDSCKAVVIIDHHRKMVGHIDNAVIFYHEQYASSASEMVSELVQYMNKGDTIEQNDAESLLAGIMLDTKNFVMKTGVRTFEAAAYLRKKGADTVEVKKLFSDSMESYQRRAQLVSSAEIFQKCAISVCDDANFEDIRIVAAQSADELLSIKNVDASFVLYELNGEISISGRSLGAINVQLILEKIGGGGHLTMAGAQIKDVTISQAREMLINSIREYNETISQANTIRRN